MKCINIQIANLTYTIYIFSIFAILLIDGFEKLYPRYSGYCILVNELDNYIVYVSYRWMTILRLIQNTVLYVNPSITHLNKCILSYGWIFSRESTMIIQFKNNKYILNVSDSSNPFIFLHEYRIQV